MIGVKPYIAFSGNCEEAVNFYKDVLGGEILYMGRYGESPMSQPGLEQKILHTTLQIGDTHIMACDSMSDQKTTQGDNISLAIGTSDIGAAEKMFERMAEGGTVVMPMQQTFWAERFGMLKDKFGINWMFNCEKPREGGEA